MRFGPAVITRPTLPGSTDRSLSIHPVSTPSPESVARFLITRDRRGREKEEASSFGARFEIFLILLSARRWSALTAENFSLLCEAPRKEIRANRWGAVDRFEIKKVIDRRQRFVGKVYPPLPSPPHPTPTWDVTKLLNSCCSAGTISLS